MSDIGKPRGCVSMHCMSVLSTCHAGGHGDLSLVDSEVSIPDAKYKSRI